MADIDVEPEMEALVVQDKGYYDIFNFVDMDQIAISAIHHKELTEFAHVGVGMGGGFENTKELQVMTYKKAIKGSNGKH